MSKIRTAFERLTRGEIGVKANPDDLARTDEVGKLFSSLDFFLEKLNEASSFASSIGNGNLSVKFSALSDDDCLATPCLLFEKNLSQ